MTSPDLRAAVEGLRLVESKTDFASGWNAACDLVHARIEPGAVLVTESGLAAALGTFWPGYVRWKAWPDRSLTTEAFAAAVLAILEDPK